MMPRPRLILLFALAGLPLVAGVALPMAGQIGMALTFLVFAVAIADRAASPSLSSIDVHRKVSDVLSVGTENRVELQFRNQGMRFLRITVTDNPPEPSEQPELPITLELPPQRNRYCVYHTVPQHRGRGRFRDVQLRCTSRLGLWTLCENRPMRQDVKIYPDIKAVHGVELLARHNRLAEAGVRLSRIRGRGNEFERLREYRRDDEYRTIDWKATARRRQLISREYVVERNQNILFLLDCGRSMCNMADGISHFDRALNAAILLAYVALRQGDTVGLLAFSHRVERWVRPLRGAGSIQTLIGQTYDLEPSYVASDYSLMVDELKRRHRKRSLVILLTHALDDVHLQSISREMHRLKSPHLALGAFLKNVPLMERVNTVPSTDLEAFQVAAAAEVAGEQSLQLARLQQSGLLVVDAEPENLSADLVTRYLDIKARHLL